MSDRIADEADELCRQVTELAEKCEGKKLEAAERAADELTKVAALDRKEHGATPTDKLVQLAEESNNRCIVCGDETDGAVFCGYDCLTSMGDSA